MMTTEARPLGALAVEPQVDAVPLDEVLCKMG
jgi:hypothetical protein